MMLMKIFMKIKICLILVTIHKIEIFLILPIKKVIGKKIDEFRGKIVGLSRKCIP